MSEDCAPERLRGSDIENNCCRMTVFDLRSRRPAGNMTEEEKEKIRLAIHKSIGELLASIEGLEEGARPVSPDNALGRLTRMEALGAQGVSKAALDKARGRLSKLNQTLKKIDDPDYGTCIGCKLPIAFERMEAMPESRLCVRSLRLCHRHLKRCAAVALGKSPRHVGRCLVLPSTTVARERDGIGSCGL